MAPIGPWSVRRLSTQTSLDSAVRRLDAFDGDVKGGPFAERQGQHSLGPQGGTPLVAIDFAPKALVWEDDQGKVWLSYNSADYLYKTIYPRHGIDAPPMAAPICQS